MSRLINYREGLYIMLMYFGLLTTSRLTCTEDTCWLEAKVKLVIIVVCHAEPYHIIDSGPKLEGGCSSLQNSLGEK